MSCAKTPEPIEMPFRIWTRVGRPRNRVLDGIQIAPCQGIMFRGKAVPVHVRRHYGELCKDGWTDRDAVWAVDSGGPRNHVLDVGPDRPKRRGNFWGETSKQHARGHAQRQSSVSCAKMAEPIEISFGLWTRVGPRNHVLDVGTDPPSEEAIFRGKHMPGMPDDTKNVLGGKQKHWRIPGEYYWTVMCGGDAAFFSNCFDHSLKLGYMRVRGNW